MVAEELYEMRLRHIKSDDPRDDMIVSNKVKGFLYHLINDEGMSEGTARIAYNAIGSFFESQGLSFKIRSRDLPRYRPIGKKVILKEQIRKIIEELGTLTRPRNKALVMVAKDTGLRVSDIAQMTVGWYQDCRVILNEFDEIFKSFKPIKSKKTGGICYPHMGPEAIKAVDEYLEHRKEDGEVLGEASPLWLSTGEDKVRLTRVALSNLFVRLTDKLGSEGDDVSAHSFRKFFETNLEASGVHKNWIGKYFDKTVSDSSAPYSRPEDIPGLLTDTYIEHYDALRIYETGDLRELRSKIKEMEEDRKEIKELKEEIASLKEIIRELPNIRDFREKIEKQ